MKFVYAYIGISIMVWISQPLWTRRVSHHKLAGTGTA